MAVWELARIDGGEVISSITGDVASVNAEAAVVSVNGVGLRVVCPPNVLGALRPGEGATLATSLVVREDSLTLFGFSDADQRDVFDQLQSVSGVGPRLALAVLGAMSPDHLRHVVAAEDERALTAIPGVGRKSAGRLILELADKLGPARSPVDIRDAVPSPVGMDQASRHQQVVEAMVGLGWSGAQAECAVAAVVAEMAQDPSTGESPGAFPDVAEILRRALRAMGGP